MELHEILWRRNCQSCEEAVRRIEDNCSKNNKNPDIDREIKAEDQRSKSVSHWRDFLLLPMLRPKG